MYFAIEIRVLQGGANMSTPMTEQRKQMNGVLGMWTDAAQQGNAKAQYNLGVV